MSFETEAELSLTVDEGDLRNVQQQIEEGIGTTEVGVTDGGSMSAQSGGGRAGRRSMRLAETRNDILSEQLVFLEEIEDQVGTGDGGGGGLITELIGVGGETAGDVAVETGDTVADAVSDVITGTVSTALGNTIAGAINGSEVEVEDVDPLPVEDPGPLAVEDPSPLAVEEAGPIDTNVTVDVTGGSGRGRTQTTRPTDRRGALQRGGAVLDNIGAFVSSVLLPGEAPPSASEPLPGAGTPAGRPFETLGREIGTANPRGSTTVQNNVETTARPQIEISVDTDRLLSEVESAIDEANQEVKQELREEIDRVASDLADVERDIRRGAGAGSGP
jgi:hypothetical protein